MSPVVGGPVCAMIRTMGTSTDNLKKQCSEQPGGHRTQDLSRDKRGVWSREGSSERMNKLQSICLPLSPLLLGLLCRQSNEEVWRKWL